MPYPIERKLVVAVSSSALFDLGESDAIFRKDGEAAYRQYQLQHLNVPFEGGVALPFVRRLLGLNLAFPEDKPIEVILLSKNSVETGLRAFRSIAHHGLDISRACFSSGKENYQYLPAYNATLFLSSYEEAARKAIAQGLAAGVVIGSPVQDDATDTELRIAFDFDGVVADSSSELIYQKEGLEGFQAHELEHADLPLFEGPLAKLLRQISLLQDIERARTQIDSSYQRIVRTAIVTARNAPAHERVVTTLQRMKVNVDEVFFLGGIEKARILDILRPHLFFDDQIGHLEPLKGIPAVYIPSGFTELKGSAPAGTPS